MFRLVDKNSGILFASYDLGQTSQNINRKLVEEVEAIDANRLLNTAPEDLKRYLVEKYRIAPVVLLRDQWYADVRDAPVDVRHDLNRWIDDRSRPVMVAGEHVEIRVPFEGEGELFFARANRSTMNPPRAVIDKNELVLRYSSPADNPRDVRPLVDQALAEIEEHLEWQRGMLQAHNEGLDAAAGRAIADRRNRLLAQSQRAESLGIPLRQKSGMPQTYVVPSLRRKVTPTLPPATTAQFKPEPAMAMEHYEHVLKIVQDMALVMERSPNAFKSMDEEALRQHFLVQLNGQFEGKATGETFNMEGKTDILLREGDRNVFIAECKFWKGPKAFGEAIDQLLRYATWRDSKTAILVFNRGVDTTTVLSGIDSVTKGHSNFKRPVNWPHESGFRYVLHSTGDKNRELMLTVLVFHVPK